jgi:gamma-glutamylputrescine oxidase
MANFSYWEQKSWLNNIDFTIVGSGIVGLFCALWLKNKYPKSNILILEKGLLPQGGSTKNAGFACFGSVSEILDDLQNHDETTVFNLVQKRYEGLQLLQQQLGDTNIGFKHYGGYEIFTQQDQALFEQCYQKLSEINQQLKPIFKSEVFCLKDNSFGFKNIIKQYIYNAFEGQIDTGKMMATLLKKVQSAGVKILNNTIVKSYTDDANQVHIQTDNFNVSTKKLIIATNGFASQLGINNVKPARAQVLITKPIENLKIKGTFHLDRGYYYFRNIDDRILFGGGRNLDFITEETTEFNLTDIIQNKLEHLLKTVILPDTNFEIDQRWSGIMGVGMQKEPIVKQLSNHVYCGVRMGGMGVAIGSLVGKELAELTD